MNIYVQVWSEIDPTLNIRVDRTSGEAIAEQGDVLRRVSPIGREAVSIALAMRPTDVTAFSVGTGHLEALRYALAAGATRAVELEVKPAESPVFAVADWLLQQKPDLVIADRMAGLIAGHLTWSHLAGLDNLEFEKDRLQAVRHLGRGNREIVSARLPAVVRLHAESTRPPYLSRARIRAITDNLIQREQISGEKHQESLEIGCLQPARPRTRLGQQVKPRSKRGSDRFAALMAQPNSKQSSDDAEPSPDEHATPESMAEEFIRYLIHNNLLPLRNDK